jgi:tetratricopeptide (TPR) repeat protein
MLASLRTEVTEPLYQVSMLRLLGRVGDARTRTAFLEALGSKSGWVRSAAAEGLGASPDREVLAGLLRATRDDLRLVRVRAALALAEAEPATLEPGDRAALESAWSEAEAGLRNRAGEPAAMEALGHFLRQRGRLVEAAGIFEAMIEAGQESAGMRINAASVRFSMGDAVAAERHLRRALALEPRGESTWFNWIVFLERQQRVGDSISARLEAKRRLSVDERTRLEGRLAEWEQSLDPQQAQPLQPDP